MVRLVFILSLILPFSVEGQFRSDNFDSYNVGSFDQQFDSILWEGWAGNSSGCQISSDFALSGTNSLLVEENDDIVALLGVINKNRYSISYSQYVVGGHGAYSNLQYDYTSEPFGGRWLVQSYISSDGTAVFNTDGDDITFVPIYDQWIKYEYLVNFDTSIGEFYYNGQLISSFAVDTDVEGGPGLNQVNAINFFGTCQNDDCVPLAYYDDIEVALSPEYDYNVNFSDGAIKSEYSLVPENQLQPLKLESKVLNVGQETVTNVQVAYTVENESGQVVFQETTEVILTLEPGEEYIFISTDSYTPLISGEYVVVYEVLLDEVDEYILDNTLESRIKVEISPDTYARDDGNYINGLGINNGTGSIGQVYQIFETVTLDGIGVYYFGGAIGEEISASIWSVDDTGSPIDQIFTSSTQTIDQLGNLGNEVYTVIEFEDNVLLPPGEYLFVLDQLGTTNISVAVSEAIYTSGKSFAAFDRGGWQSIEDFDIQVAIAIRPIITAFSTLVTTIDSAHMLRIYPNPSPRGYINIETDLPTDRSKTLSVFDTNGRLVTQITNHKDVNHYDLSSLGSGIYFLELRSSHYTAMQRVVIK